MIFVIGDIHGEVAKLTALSDKIFSHDPNPSFVFIGDYLDKGEDPYNCLRFLEQLSHKAPCTFLRGNHEYYWEILNPSIPGTAEYLLKYGGKETVRSIDPALNIYEAREVLFSEFQSFFQQLKNYLLLDEYLLVHSGLKPQRYHQNMDTVEVDDILFNRYDFIQYPELYQGRKILFGHTGFFYPYYDGVKIGLDTAACYLPKQPLTAFCIEGEFFIDSRNSVFKLNALDLNSCPVIPRVKPWREKTE